MWEKISSISTFASFIISVAALFVAINGTESSTKIATEALETARQANEISLGKIREPAVIEFEDKSEKAFEFNLTSAIDLDKEFSLIVMLFNKGNSPVDALTMKIIGVMPLTYPLDAPDEVIRPLPAIDVTVNFKTLFLPEALAHIDMRHALLKYLSKLAEQITDKNRTYITSANLLILPKALKDPVFAEAPPLLTRYNDRRLINITFIPSMLESELAKQQLNETEIPVRMFGK